MTVTKRLTCFARFHGDQWEAICLDFDIAVQTATLDDAVQMLGEAIHGYVTAALAEDEQTKQRLLNRRAPLSVRLQHKVAFLWRMLFRRGDDDEMQAGFDLPCHA